ETTSVTEPSIEPTESLEDKGGEDPDTQETEDIDVKEPVETSEETTSGMEKETEQITEPTESIVETGDREGADTSTDGEGASIIPIIVIIVCLILAGILAAVLVSKKKQSASNKENN